MDGIVNTFELSLPLIGLSYSCHIHSRSDVHIEFLLGAVCVAVVLLLCCVCVLLSYVCVLFVWRLCIATDVTG